MCEQLHFIKYVWCILHAFPVGRVYRLAAPLSTYAARVILSQHVLKVAQAAMPS